MAGWKELWNEVSWKAAETCDGGEGTLVHHTQLHVSVLCVCMSVFYVCMFFIMRNLKQLP